VGIAGGDIYNQSNDVFAPPALQFAPTPGLPGTLVISSAQNQNFNVNANAVYTLKTANGVSSTLQAGVQYETRSFNVSRIAASNLVGGIRNIRAGTSSVVEQDKQLTKDFGLFGQEELLMLNEKLLLTVGMRADQSSNNGDPSKVFLYPKASASYRLLIKPGVVDEVKLRAAAGFAGNQPKYGQKFTELRPGNVAGVAVSQILGLTGASGIIPERQREIEAGLDATLFKSRGTLEATIYEKRITELLLTRTLAPVTGYSTQYLNGGAMKTSGLELGANALPIQSAAVQWSVGSTFFLTRCKVLSLPAGIQAFTPQSFLGGNSFGKTFIEPGKSCTQVYGRDSLGRLPGDAALGAIGSSIVRYVVDTRPDYRFSLSNDFTFKHLRFYFLFDRQKGGRVACITCILWDRSGNRTDQVVATESGALTATQRGAAYAKTATIVYQDASFWKLREATLGYELPTGLVRGVWSGARYVRLSLQGRNLLTVTKYRGTDPEVNSIVESAAFEEPWELWAYPPSRSVWFSVELGF
jgi:outer membrane receptor protein involved in Fe transport